MESKEEEDDAIYSVIYDYKAREKDELTLIAGTLVKVLSINIGEDGWWFGLNGKNEGVFPSNYVKKLDKQKCTESTNDDCKIENSAIASSQISKPVPNNSSNTNNKKSSITSSNCYKNEKINEFVKIEDIPQYKFSELEIKKFIGSGGFSKVYHGIDLKDLKERKDVAVKELSINTRNGDKAIPDFHQEAKLCWHLKHPYIIRLYGMCVDSPHYCLIMEYAKGGTLRRLLEFRKTGLPPLTLIQWALQVAYGMQFLHEEAGITIIHRDLKSSNVLLSDEVTDQNLDDITLKLSDFGLARETQKNGGNIMTIAGTYRWMSPEVLKLGEYSKASDIWSFGVLLWELLTGEIPFENFDFDYRLIYGIGEGLRLPIPSTCPEIFSNLLKSCWCDEPSERFTIKQIIETLIEISNSDFAETPCDSFKILQDDFWKPEINQMFEQMCIDIKEREKELHAKAIELERRSDELEQWAKELEEREKLVIIRELSSALHHHQSQAPEPKKRQFFKGFHLFKHHDKRIDIGPPSDFTHCITVQADQHENISGSISNLPASPLSTTTLLSGGTTPNHNLATPTLPIGSASPSLRLRVFLPGQNTELINGLNGNNFSNQTKRDKSLSNENSSDNQGSGSGLSTPKQSRSNKHGHLSRQKTPKQTTIWYNDLRSNSLDSDTVFNEKKDDINDSHSSTMPSYHINPHHIHNYNNHNNKKIGKIFYEIGSFLGIIGLGKDYKKEIVGDAKPPIHSKTIRKSSSPNTLQRSKASLDAENKNSRDETPPSSLSRVNKTYPYRVKSSSGNKNKIKNNKNDPNNISSDVHSGSSSLQSSPKIQSSRIGLNPINQSSINRKQSSSIATHHHVISQQVTTETNFHYTDDSGIYGDSRKEVIDDELRHKASLIRPVSLNIKSELEKSNVFQKRRDILTSSNSTEDDDNASFKNDGVISQLINASNVMRDQMRILIDNDHQQQQQRKKMSVPRSNSKTPASSTQHPTPNEEFSFVNTEAHNKIKMLSKQLYKHQISKSSSNNNDDADDQNLQSTIL